MGKINLKGAPDAEFAKADTLKRNDRTDIKPQSDRKVITKANKSIRGKKSHAYYLRIGDNCSERIERLSSIADTDPEVIIRSVRKNLAKRVREEIPRFNPRDDSLFETGMTIRGTLSIQKDAFENLKKKHDPFDLGLATEVLKMCILHVFEGELRALEERFETLSNDVR